MGITIYDATKLNTFRKFRLISGVSGLGNPIEKVGILDWEFFIKEEGQFIKGEFVLSSLMFAKDNPDYILESVLDLVHCGVSGLAVKNVYYNELPQEVVKFSNENDFPIFIFDNSAYFEDIITEVMDKIRFAGNYELLETKVDILIKKQLDKVTVKEIAYEINSSFKDAFFSIYIKSRQYWDDNQIIAFLEQIKRSNPLSLYSTAMKYRGGILLIVTAEKMDSSALDTKMDVLLRSLSIDQETFYAGASNAHRDLSMLNIGINESLYAEITSEVMNVHLKKFSDIGLYSVVLPYKDDIWMRSFYEGLTLPIKNYDEKYNTELFETAVIYIEKEGNIIETAKALFIHKNTVRYRLEKIKEILDMDSGFYEQLAIAMKLHNVQSLK
ncbi:MAG: PucR family transcriptional regulator [Clostridia bacterium]|nr:PucR family transcriptional regulator [Clostridia bacterium]